MNTVNTSMELSTQLIRLSRMSTTMMLFFTLEIWAMQMDICQNGTSSKSKLLTSQHVSHTWLQSMWSTHTLIMYPGSHFDSFVIWDLLVPKTEMVWCLLVDLCQWKLWERLSKHWVILPEQELLRRVSQHRPSSTCWPETRQKHGTWFTRTSVQIDNTNAFLVFVKWRKVCIPVWGAIYFDFICTMNPFWVECWEVE